MAAGAALKPAPLALGTPLGTGRTERLAAAPRLRRETCGNDCRSGAGLSDCRCAPGEPGRPSAIAKAPRMRGSSFPASLTSVAWAASALPRPTSGAGGASSRHFGVAAPTGATRHTAPTACRQSPDSRDATLNRPAARKRGRHSGSAARSNVHAGYRRSPPADFAAGPPPKFAAWGACRCCGRRSPLAMRDSSARGHIAQISKTERRAL